MQQIDRPDPDRGGNLEAPVAMPSRSHGSFDDGARRSGAILDADRVRAAALVGVPLAAFRRRGCSRAPCADARQRGSGRRSMAAR